MRIEKTVFISYRRTSQYSALSVFQHVRAAGYDVFFDYQSLDSGSFERVIVGEIKARAHFLVILQPDTLLRCSEPGDWVRREIELAIDTGRNIIPLVFDGFTWGGARPYLTGKLAQLGDYNNLSVPIAFFDEAMGRLTSRYLNKSLDLVLHPVAPAQRVKAQRQITAAAAASPVTEKQLTAAEHFSSGCDRYEKRDYDGAIADYNEAIRLDPNYAAYNNRGLARYDKKDYDGAIADYYEAIRLNPNYAAAYNNRGLARYDKGDYDSAIADSSEAIRLDSNYALAYNNRGIARRNKQDYDGAIADSSEAIRLNPNYAHAYNNRGIARRNKQDYDGAIADFSEAIRLNPNYARAYNNRGMAKRAKGDTRDAEADFIKARQLDPSLFK